MLPITRDLEVRPLGCLNPEQSQCPGIMEKMIVAPTIHGSAMPTRRKNDGVQYYERPGS